MKCLFSCLYKQELCQIGGRVAAMADLALLEDLNARLRRERVFRDRADFFKEGDEWLLSRLCLPRHLLMELCNALEPQLRRETRRSNAIPVPVQVCSTLGFFWPPGPFSGRSGTGLVFPSHVLAEPCQQFWQLYCPSLNVILNSHNDQQTGIKRDFYAIARFPNVIGAVDCTHMRIY